MANTDTSTSEARPAPAASKAGMALLAPAIGWLIPGAGHLIQRRWVRGFVLMACVVAMFTLGLVMDGKIYKPNTGDLLEMLAFVGDLGAGGLYILGRILDWGSNAIAYATASYGTIYMVVAGLLNIMCVVDAYHIAIGKKP